MIINRFNRFLYSEATELAQGGGAAASMQAISATPDQEPEEKPEVAPEKGGEEEKPEEKPASEPAKPAEGAKSEPTLLQMAFAAAKNKAALVKDAAEWQARAEAAENELQVLRAQKSELSSKIQDLTTEREKIREALETSQNTNKTVEAAAAAQVAVLGFPEATLPDTVKAGDTVGELEAQLEAEKDNKRRWEIAKKLNAMRA